MAEVIELSAPQCSQFCLSADRTYLRCHGIFEDGFPPYFRIPIADVDWIVVRGGRLCVCMRDGKTVYGLQFHSYYFSKLVGDSLKETVKAFWACDVK